MEKGLNTVSGQTNIIENKMGSFEFIACDVRSLSWLRVLHESSLVIFRVYYTLKSALQIKLC